MRTITTVAEMTAARAAMRGTVGLVPTMGYLHEGHLSLVRRAQQDNDHVVVTIFVNPTQFGPNEDLNRYPRDEQRDFALLKEILGSPLPRTGEGLGVRALVFIPTTDEIYPPGFDDWVEVTGAIAERLEGAHRPGHFRGVTTVCARLFRIIRPDRAYFGQKDAQQLRIIRRMVEEQHIPVDIIPMPIIREPGGLAMSSRNAYLSSDERRVAVRLSESLSLAEHLVMGRGVTGAESIRAAIREVVGAQGLAPLQSGHPQTPLPARPEVLVGRAAAPRLELDYISVAGEETLEELQTIDRPALILLAARIGPTRLIDNTIVVPMGMPIPDGLRPLMSF